MHVILNELLDLISTMCFPFPFSRAAHGIENHAFVDTISTFLTERI